MSPEQIQSIRARVRAGLIAQGIDSDEKASALLAGNWRRTAPPPVEEYVAHCLIVEKESGRLIPFRLWEAQREALEVFAREPFAIAAKGRQIGLTWLVLALMAWEADFGGNRLFPIARQSEDYAKDAITRIMYLRGLDPVSGRVLTESRMPPEWRRPIVSKTTTQLTLANGSSFHALTATQHIGRGFAAYRGLADEFAFWPWQEEQRKALESGCARLAIVSTGNGEGDDFHRTWELAVSGKGKYRPVFVSAEADPRRDEEWFRLHVEEDADPAGAAREYARSVEDVFRPASGRFFKRFSRERNVREFAIVHNWPASYAVDFGFNYPACLLIQVSPAGQPFVFGEWCPEQTETPEFARGILRYQQELLAAEGVELAMPMGPMYCDPAGKARNMQTAKSEFDVMRAAGFRPMGQPSGVRDGCVLLMNAIAHESIPLVVHPRCEKLIRALTQMPPDKSDPDVYDQKRHPFSDPLDALRYWFVNNRGPRSEFVAPPPMSRRRERIF